MSENLELIMYFVWLFIMIMAIVIEFSTSIYIGWAAFIASSAALITHGITKNLGIEITVFMASWILLWLMMFMLGKYVFKKKLHDNNDGYMFYIGKEYEAKKSNALGFGYLSINDKMFRFTSADKIEKGEKVRIKKIIGVTFKVEKIKENIKQGEEVK